MSEKQTFIEEPKETVVQTVPFKSMQYKPSKGQKFGRPKIVIKGEEKDIYDMIQAAREDTEIYPTLEKYGCLDRIERDTEAIYGDYTAIKDLRGLIEQNEAAENLWNTLPLEMRTHFQNNKALFMEGAEEYLQKKIKEEKQDITQTTTTEKATAENKGAENNA